MNIVGRKPWRCLLAVALAAAALEGPAHAGERSVTVMATGEVKSKPTTVEISLVASGSAELSADALVKYRASVRRTLDAFTGLKLERLKVSQEDLTIGSPNQNNGEYAVPSPVQPGAEMPHPQVSISRALRLQLSGAQELTEDQLIETIVKIMDVAKDSGNSIVGAGSPAMVSFSVEKADALRDKACQTAMSQARARAARYAELAGARLGEVQSVEELEAPTDESNAMWPPYQYQGPGSVYYATAASGGGRLTSASLGEIPVRVTLRVRFAMLPPVSEQK